MSSLFLFIYMHPQTASHRTALPFREINADDILNRPWNLEPKQEVCVYTSCIHIYIYVCVCVCADVIMNSGTWSQRKSCVYVVYVKYIKLKSEARDLCEHVCVSDYADMKCGCFHFTKTHALTHSTLGVALPKPHHLLRCRCFLHVWVHRAASVLQLVR
jgi:hypothetical protein